MASRVYEINTCIRLNMFGGNQPVLCTFLKPVCLKSMYPKQFHRFHRQDTVTAAAVCDDLLIGRTRCDMLLQFFYWDRESFR